MSPHWHGYQLTQGFDRAWPWQSRRYVVTYHLRATSREGNQANAKILYAGVPCNTGVGNPLSIIGVLYWSLESEVPWRPANPTVTHIG